jgi:hypothetical protein
MCNSDHDVVYSHELNFPTFYGVTQATLRDVDGAGVHIVGISGYKYFQEDYAVILNAIIDFPYVSFIYSDEFLGVTFKTAVGAHDY